jgi:transmembrane sensor
MDGRLMIEHSQRMRISRAIRAEAAAWIARLHSDSRTSQDDRGFRDWLAARPEHSAAYQSLTAAWHSVAAIRAERRPVAATESSPMRRRVLLAAFGSAAAIAIGLFTWETSIAGVYQTAIGEQKHVALDDGTEVFLDADSRIRVKFDHHRRLVELQKGRANFRVASDSTRQFVVQAVTHEVVADQSTFDVRRDGDQLTVVLTRGQVSVAADNSTNPAPLAAGQRLIATTSNVTIDQPNLRRLVAWQSGQAIFDNDTLEAATREMNRYSTVALSIGDAAAAGLHLSGVYRIGDNQTFARSIVVLLPVKIVAADNGIKLVIDPARSFNR